MKIVVASSNLMEFEPRHLERISQITAPHELVATHLSRPADHLGAVSDADILFGLITPDAIVEGRRLRWVHSLGTAVDDLEMALHGRSLILTGEGVKRSYLAEHAFALLLALTRGVTTAIRQPGAHMRIPIRRQQMDLAGATIVIVGYGGAGRALAQRARAFEMHVIAIDPYAEDAGAAHELHPSSHFDVALPRADVVAICAPLTPDTRGLFDADRFSRLKRGAILINIGRGEIVDEDALMASLLSGQLGGAGLDVAPRDPLPDGHPLWTMPNVVVTPHVAGGSPGRLDAAIDTFATNLRHLVNGEPLIGLLHRPGKT